MKVFFSGYLFGNSGPSIVNKNIVSCLRDSIITLTSYKKLYCLFESLYKTTIADFIVFSGLNNYSIIVMLYAQMLRKKTLYIMHGCRRIEAKWNHNYNWLSLINEDCLIKNCCIILCVSRPYADYIKRQYPQFVNKISSLTNGVDWETLDNSIMKYTNIAKNKNQILLLGGGRVTKRNLQVCQAVQQINEEMGMHLYILVYGNYCETDDSSAIKKIDCVEYRAIIPHEEMLEIEKQSRIFIQNSEIESFGLGLIEALMCGCDVLYSKNVGAKDIIRNSREEDIIENPLDVDEIVMKLKNLILCGNNERLLGSINRNETSIQTRANELMNIITQML